MSDIASKDQAEFAGFEDVVALIESIAIAPAPSVKAAHIGLAVGATSSKGLRFIRRRRRSGRPATLRAYRRAAALLVAFVLSISGLAVAGVLPDEAQNRAADIARVVGWSLPTAPDSSLVSPAESSSSTDSGEGDDWSTTVDPRDPTPSLGGSEACAVVDDDAGDQEGDDTQRPCAEADDEREDDQSHEDEADEGEEADDDGEEADHDGGDDGEAADRDGGDDGEEPDDDVEEEADHDGGEDDEPDPEEEEPDD